MIGMKGSKELRTNRSSNSAMDEHGSKKFVAFQIVLEIDRFIFLAAGYPAFFVSPILFVSSVVFFAVRNRGSATNKLNILPPKRNVKSKRAKIDGVVPVVAFWVVNCNL